MTKTQSTNSQEEVQIPALSNHDSNVKYPSRNPGSSRLGGTSVADDRLRFVNKRPHARAIRRNNYSNRGKASVGSIPIKNSPENVDDDAALPSDQNTKLEEKEIDKANILESSIISNESRVLRSSTKRGNDSFKNVSQCPICLSHIAGKCYSSSCLHTFCFSCLKSWCKVDNVCPLCKTGVNHIIHSVKSDYDYKEFKVTPPKKPSILSWTNIRSAMEVPGYRARFYLIFRTLENTNDNLVNLTRTNYSRIVQSLRYLNEGASRVREASDNDNSYRFIASLEFIDDVNNSEENASDSIIQPLSEPESIVNEPSTSTTEHDTSDVSNPIITQNNTTPIENLNPPPIVPERKNAKREPKDHPSRIKRSTRRTIQPHMKNRDIENRRETRSSSSPGGSGTRSLRSLNVTNIESNRGRRLPRPDLKKSNKH